MKYVLLKLDDDKAEKFLEKYANKFCLGVWEVAVKCHCSKAQQASKENWEWDYELLRPVCITCGGVHTTVTTLAERLQMAFQGRNLISRYRTGKTRR